MIKNIRFSNKFFYSNGIKLAARHEYNRIRVPMHKYISNHNLNVLTISKITSIRHTHHQVIDKCYRVSTEL